MERFVRDFNGAVMRAEAGIKALRAAARDSGDDLEKLVEKAIRVRDELHFIVESADGVAERLSTTASNVMRDDSALAPGGTTPDKAAAKVEQRAPRKPSKPDVSGAAPVRVKTDAPVVSRAEQELLQVLQKLSGGNS
jgi:hypothetical protein